MRLCVCVSVVIDVCAALLFIDLRVSCEHQPEGLMELDPLERFAQEQLLAAWFTIQ